METGDCVIYASSSTAALNNIGVSKFSIDWLEEAKIVLNLIAPISHFDSVFTRTVHIILV